MTNHYWRYLLPASRDAEDGFPFSEGNLSNWQCSFSFISSTDNKVFSYNTNAGGIDTNPADGSLPPMKAAYLFSGDSNDQ